MTSFLALRASVCVSNSPGMLFPFFYFSILFLFLFLLAIYVVSSMSVECLIPPPRLGWNSYLGSILWLGWNYLDGTTT